MSEYYVNLEQETEGLGTEPNPFNASQLFSMEKNWGDIFYVRGTYSGEFVDVVDGGKRVCLRNWDLDLYGSFDLGVILAIPIP
jgi:hypothetical protein